MSALLFSLSLLFGQTVGNFRDEAESLVHDLKSDRSETRARATERLKELGTGAEPALQKASRDSDPEVANRARYLLRCVELGRILGAPLLRSIPGLKEQLAGPDPHEWSCAFLEAVASPEGAPLYPELTDADIAPLALRALKHAENAAEKRSILQVICDRGMRVALPEVRALLRSKDLDVSLGAFNTLVRWDALETMPDLLALLRDIDPDLRRRAVWAVGQLGDSSYIAQVEGLFGDGDPGVRCTAVVSWGILGRGKPVRALAALLADAEAEVRIRTIRVLGEAGDRSVVPALLPFLGSSNVSIRAAAVRALGQLGALDALANIRELSSDPRPLVRAEVLQALDILGSPNAVLLESALKDPERTVRVTAASLLCQGGDIRGLDVLVKERQALHTANGLRSIEQWKRFSGADLKSTVVGLPLDALASLMHASGIPLRISADLEAKAKGLRESFRFRGGADGTWRIMDAVLEVLSSFERDLDEPVTMILEKDGLRIIRVREAAEFWEAWRTAEENAGKR